MNFEEYFEIKQKDEEVDLRINTKGLTIIQNHTFLKNNENKDDLRKKLLECGRINFFVDNIVSEINNNTDIKNTRLNQLKLFYNFLLDNKIVFSLKIESKDLLLLEHIFIVQNNCLSIYNLEIIDKYEKKSYTFSHSINQIINSDFRQIYKLIIKGVNIDLISYSKFNILEINNINFLKTFEYNHLKKGVFTFKLIGTGNNSTFFASNYNKKGSLIISILNDTVNNHNGLFNFTFIAYPYTELYIDGFEKINHCVITGIQGHFITPERRSVVLIKDCTFIEDAFIRLNNLYLNNFGLSLVNNFSKSFIINKLTIIKGGEFRLNESFLGGLILNNLDCRMGKKIIRATVLKDVHLNNCSFLGKGNYEKIYNSDKNESKDTYRLFKQKMIADNNQIDALKFQTKELNTYINESGDLSKKIILIIQKWVSNHGTNWLQALTSILVVNILLYLLCIKVSEGAFLEYEINSNVIKHLDGFSNFIFPFKHDFSFFYLFVTSINGYLFYQLIISLRIFSRK